MTTAETTPKLLTADDLLRLSNRRVVKGELVRGVLKETMAAGGEHSEIAAALSTALVNHVRPLRLGRVSTSDAGVLLERDPYTVREPDVAYFSAETLPLDVKVRGYYEVVPDLVIEIVSPGDRPAEVAERVAMWQDYGVPLVWAVYPVERIVAAHVLEGPTVIYTEDDTLDGGSVLPEFRCTVRDILDW